MNNMEDDVYLKANSAEAKARDRKGVLAISIGLTCASCCADLFPLQYIRYCCQIWLLFLIFSSEI